MRANNNGGDNHLYMMDTLFDDNNNNIMISGCVNGVIGGNGGVVVGRNGLKRHRDDTRQRDDIVSFKRNMTLDFNAPASNKKEKLMKTCVLESPDLKKINIGSPEMEQMIIANGLMSGTTPTPGVLPQYFLKQESEATEEQEQFSRGFTEALDKLHHQTSNGSGDDIHMNGLISDHSNSHHTISMSNHHQQQQQQHQQQHHQSNHSSNSVTIVDQQQQQHQHQQHQQQQQHHSNNSVNNNGLSVVTSNGYANHSNNNHNNSNSVDDSVFNVSATIMPVTTSSNCVQFAIPSIPPHEQYVNVATSNGGEVIISGAIESSNCNTNSNSSSNTCGSALPTYASHISNSQQMAPIDMGEQERIKLERKRLRNRIAASKCRRRKLERISRLEDKVKSLKGENAELSIVVNKLRDQVCSLKQQVMDHVKCGCQLMVNQQ